MKDRDRIGKECVFYVPRKTREIMDHEIWMNNGSYQSSDFPKNPALIFAKLIPNLMNYKKDETTKASNREEILRKVIKEGKEDRESKHKYLKLVTQEMKKLNDEIQKGNFPFLSKVEKLVEDLQSSGYKIQKVEGKINWRLIVGLGAAHPEETSMTLHHIYGIPYIPGSALKGVTRHWTLLKFAEVYHKNLRDKRDAAFEEAIKIVSQSLEYGKDLDISIVCEYKDQRNCLEERITFSEIMDMFGTRRSQGKTIFLDAYPSGAVDLQIDIINPHYPEYYSKSKQPGDWQQPVPVPFLAIENAKFVFYLGIRENENFNLLKKATFLMADALCKHGIGAKTSLGYGIFNLGSIHE